MKGKESSIKYLNQVLKTIKDINKIISKETELENLCNSVCSALITNRGYSNVWLILTEDGVPVQPYYHKGFGKNFEPMTKALDEGRLPSCVETSLISESLLIIKNPIKECPECPFAHQYTNDMMFSKSLIRNNKIMGWITVSVPEESARDKEEQELFSDMIEDISFAIENIINRSTKNNRERDYKAILDNTSDSIIEFTCAGLILFYNKTAGDIYHIAKNLTETASIFDLFPDIEKDRLINAMSKAETEGSSLFISKVKTSDNSGFIEIEISMNFRKENIPQKNRIISIIRNLTERDKAVVLLKESEERFKLLFDRAPMGYQSLDEKGNFLEVNQQWLDMLGFEKKDVIDHWFGEFLHPDYVDSFKKRFPYFLEKGSIHSEFYMLNKKGKKRYISFDGRIGHKLDGSFQQTHCILSDHTEKKKAEDLLKECEAHFRNVFDNISAGIAVYEPCQDCDDFIIIDMNQAGQKISRVLIDEIRGKKVTKVFPAIREFGLFQVLIEVCQSGKSQQLPVRKYKDHRIEAWIENHISKTPSGRLIAIYEDRSIQKNLENRVRHFEKMELIGQLTGGIAHDFNNALNGIMNAAQLLKSPARNLDEKGLKYAGMILDASKRASELSSKLLSFSRKKNIELMPLDLHKIIIEVQEILSSTLNKSILISMELLAEESTITGNESEIHNSLLNLCINAGHAMNNSGEIQIRTGNKILDKDYCELTSFSITPGNYSWFEVCDAGSGIPQSSMDKIFEPFYTTKKLGAGTGLGLSAVYSTIQSHNGAIEVESTLGKGSIFRIYLPTSGKKIVPEQNDLPLKQGKGVILFVDDEEINRFLGKDIIESLGYSVLLAADGNEAIEIFKQKQKEISLIILDMIMPVVDGVEAFIKLREIDKGCKIILSTGFSKSDDIEKLRAMGLSAELQKPFQISELSNVIHKVLSSS